MYDAKYNIKAKGKDRKKKKDKKKKTFDLYGKNTSRGLRIKEVQKTNNNLNNLIYLDSHTN